MITFSARSSLIALVLGVLTLFGCGRSSGRYRAPQPAQATLEYWTQVQAIFARAEQQLASGRFSTASVIRDAAHAVQILPTLNVDPQVADWSLRAAGWCEQFANLIEVSSKPSTFVAAFMRGAQGDPFGVANELAAAERQSLNNYQSLRQEGIRLRAQLTTHYRIEFPASAF